MYKVIKGFYDLQDAEYEYKVGDTFPRKGKTVSDFRIKELAGPDNLQGQPLIAEEKVKAKPKAKKEA